jgi:ABC-2 type transport system ATP-binding protein
VDDICFSFGSGDIVGFIGPNGAGKTTAMRILATLDVPTDGDVLLDDLSVVDYPDKARRKIGYMPDALPMHSDITVHEYIDFFARAYGLRGKDRHRAVERIESFTGVRPISGKFLRALSKGMRQRVSLARMIIHDPDLLILDEPAAGLDPRARIELRELLKVLAEQNKAILISSHILTELAEICNCVAIIEKGRILRHGRMDAILAGDAPHRNVLLRLAEGDPEQAQKDLLLLPNVEYVSVLDHTVKLRVLGDDLACADLLTHLVGKGYRILEFRRQQVNLEEAFMSVTKGELA